MVSRAGSFSNKKKTGAAVGKKRKIYYYFERKRYYKEKKRLREIFFFDAMENVRARFSERDLPCRKTSDFLQADYIGPSSLKLFTQCAGTAVENSLIMLVFLLIYKRNFR